MPVAAQVIRHAAVRPGRIAVSGPHGEITYGDLARRARETATALRANRLTDRPGGVGPWVVGICLADPVEQLIAVLAADLAGAVPLLYEPALRDGVPANLRVETLPSGSQAGSEAGVEAGSEAGVEAGVGDAPPFAAAPGDLAWACFSSGSTGRPRAVVRTRASWTGSFEPLNAITGIGADDTVLVPGPLVSSLYGFAAVHALAAGATVLAPGRWAPGPLPELLRRATAAHLVPHLLPELLDALPDGGPLRVAVVGGAALPAGVRERAEGAGVRVVAYYGATELSFVAVDADGGGLRPFPEVEIEVRPPRGEVWARSPWLAEGYLDGVAGPLKAEDKWMSVGDLAHPYPPGEPLRLRGRGDGAIQTGGATVVPEDVEAVLRRAVGVGDVVVAGSPHPGLGAVVTAVVETGDGPLPSRAALERVARGGLAAAQRPRLWYAVAALPRTPTGKPARAELAARLAAGDPELRRLP
ncbi:class I adenylate-forming enzyme family protein [Nonomuraea sp. MCN248]|uniref:Class I adenylate-forming enzyme family protein n=1 Tax=Nonomuraea corallina TaxID=2989783 RepID=A0ABT4SLT7_9ACTN|nr:class I adenylate-forming enzyme family protein [Nonomuraea corallina]MDA0637950.1 class I adenylate-forming enzyme family protein [Nonomuraea corallina]